MGLGLVISGVMSGRGSILLLVMMVCDRVMVITVGRGGARMGKQRKRGLSARPVVNRHVQGSEKKRTKNHVTYEAPHK